MGGTSPEDEEESWFQGNTPGGIPRSDYLSAYGSDLGDTLIALGTSGLKGGSSGGGGALKDLRKEYRSAGTADFSVGETDDGRLYRYNKRTGKVEFIDGAEAAKVANMTAEEFALEFGITPNPAQLGRFNRALRTKDDKKISDVAGQIMDKRDVNTLKLNQRFTAETKYYNKVIAGARQSAKRMRNPVGSGVDQLAALYQFVTAIANDDSAVREGELHLATSAQGLISILGVQIERAIKDKDEVLSKKLARDMNRKIHELGTIAQGRRRDDLKRYREKLAPSVGADASEGVIGGRKPDIQALPTAGEVVKGPDGKEYEVQADGSFRELVRNP